MTTTPEIDTTKLIADVSVALDSIKVIREDIKKVMSSIDELSKEVRSNFVSNTTLDLVKKTIPTNEELYSKFTSLEKYETLSKSVTSIQKIIAWVGGIVVSAVVLALLKQVIIQ